MAAETHPSSSSSSDNYDYDVFLSFRGEDTRRNFTAHLYSALVRAGIRTFKDNIELVHGEEIGTRLLKAIEQSMISIPIFSKNYASSKWCLQELTKMMECMNTCGQIVWPIFYKVEPSHVRNQTGCFKEAFLKYEKEQCEEKVRAWRKALKEAANLKGWDSEDPEISLETDLINYIVERALTKVIQITTLQVAEHPIGINSHVEEVMRMLDVESQGVLFVGIHGMGGIGKTTTAKAVFNTISSQFESKIFLEDVRERASQDRGLINLQNDLAFDLLKGGKQLIGNVASGINVIKKLFCNKKVLIVLDDVDQHEQLRALAGGCDWFGSRSRIIITTRDEHILHVDLVDKSKIYKPNELDRNLSLQLFSKHAFRKDQPTQDFKELSNRVVSIVGGLPLSLIVLGSFLHDKREYTDWEDTLKMLKQFPNEQVQKRLKISYDGLDPIFKELFLDIACFFIGKDKESVILACDVKVGIKVLIYKSLVKIDSDNKLRMHDQLRDMGREIVRQENPKNPGKRSRLWSHEEALDVLKKHKGTTNVEGLFLDFGYEAKNHWIERIVRPPQIDLADLLTKASEVMPDLRLLQVDHAYHDGNFGHLPGGLTWLSLKGISSKCVPNISHLEKLAVLDLSESNITDNWIGWQTIKSIRTLKVLDLRRCHLLESTPHFSCDTSLEIQGISGLSLLQQLDLENYRKLKLLPELPPGLIKLNIGGCVSMERLPNLSTLKNLEELRLDKCCALTKIEDINGLTLLQELNLTGCTSLQSLAELPSSLIKLDATDCFSIERLPNLSNLKNLQALLLCSCRKLSEIRGISGLSLLQQLDLSACMTLQSLPELPPSLIRLDIRSCKLLERLPNLSTLKHLKEFSLDNCCKLAKIEGLDGLTLLQELDLSYCRKLQSVPELPSSLIELDARYCFSIERLANLSNLTNLQVLHLCCWNLSEIQDISGLSLLQKLDLQCCRMFPSLPGLPPSLIRLDIECYKQKLENCGQSVKLQSLDLPNMRILDSLHLEDCHNLAEIRGLESLESLTELRVCRCHTYLKTLSKSVAEGWLPTAFNEGEIYKNYLIPDDDNIKGTIFYFVYQPPPWPVNRNDFYIEVEIRRNEGTKTIKCYHDLRIQEMNANTDKYGFYSCYFQGLTWCGFPLKKRDIIHVKRAKFEFPVAEVKMLDLVMEYEAMEDSQQLENRVIHLITSTSVEREGARERGDDAGPSSSSNPVGI